MTYNLTNLTGAENLSDIVLYANQSTGGVLVGGFLMAIFFITLIKMKRYSFDQALTSASFPCFVLSLPLTIAGVLSIIWTLFFLFLAAFSGIFLNKRG